MDRRPLRAPLSALLMAGALAGGAFAQPAGPEPSQTPAPSSQLFAPIDKALLDLDTQLAVIERQLAATGPSFRGAQPRDTGEDCLSKATPSHMVANFQDLFRDPVTMNANDAFASQLADYFQCSALASGDTSVCQQAGAVFDSRDHYYPKVKDLCEFQVSRVILFSALVRGAPDFQQRCLRSLPFDFPPAARSSACSILAGEWRDPARACSDLHDALKSKTADPQFEVNFCLPQLQSINGDSGACNVSSPKDRQTCLTIAAYSRAYRARNPSLCADDLRCREMMNGNPGYCVGYARQAARSYCRINQMLAKERRIDSWNSVRDVSVAFQQFATVRDEAVPQIRSELEGIDSRLRPQDKELAMEVDDRYERLASIETRSERLAPKFITHPPGGK